MTGGALAHSINQLFRKERHPGAPLEFLCRKTGRWRECSAANKNLIYVKSDSMYEYFGFKIANSDPRTRLLDKIEEFLDTHGG